MNREELITAVAAKTGLNTQSAAEVLETIQETIMDAIRDGDKVVLPGFGTFLLDERPARVNAAHTAGEAARTAARKRPRFVPGKRFLELAQ